MRRLALIACFAFSCSGPVRFTTDGGDAVERTPGPDVAADVVGADSADDAPGVDAYDAPSDAGDVAADAGPTTHDLYAHYPTPSLSATFVESCRVGTSPPCMDALYQDIDPAGSSTFYMTVSPTDEHVSFSVRACSHGSCFDVTGAVYDNHDSSTRGPTSVLVGPTGGPYRVARVVTTERGPVDPTPGTNMSFHIEFAIDATPTVSGITGASGVTVSPTAGDIWLLGAHLY